MTRDELIEKLRAMPENLLIATYDECGDPAKASEIRIERLMLWNPTKATWDTTSCILIN